MSDIWIMRIGHRPERDKRVTTHVALSSRALGAKGIYVDTEDPVLEENIRSVATRFGGDYSIQTGVTWQKATKDFKGKIVHLTMYGQRVDEALPKKSRPRCTRGRISTYPSVTSPIRRSPHWLFSCISTRAGNTSMRTVTAR